MPIPAAEAWFSPARFPSQTGQCCACTPANMNSQPSAGWRHAPATDAWPRTCWQKFSSDLHELGRRLLLAAEEKRHDYSRASAHPGQIQTLRASNSRFECDGHLPARTSKRSRNEFWVHPECKQVPRARWRYTRQSGDDMWRLAERSTPWQAEVALSANTSSCQPPTSFSLQLGPRTRHVLQLEEPSVAEKRMTLLAARAVRGLSQLASRVRVLPRPDSPAPWTGGGPGGVGGALGCGSAVLRHGPAVGSADACLRARATFAHWPQRQLSSEATAAAEAEAPAEEVAPVAQVHLMHAAALRIPQPPRLRCASQCRRVLVCDG